MYGILAAQKHLICTYTLLTCLPYSHTALWCNYLLDIYFISHTTTTALFKYHIKHRPSDPRLHSTHPQLSPTSLAPTDKLLCFKIYAPQAVGRASHHRDTGRTGEQIRHPIYSFGRAGQRVRRPNLPLLVSA